MPMSPTANLSLGAVFPSAPNADDGMIVGTDTAPTAVAAFRRKSLRVTGICVRSFFRVNGTTTALPKTCQYAAAHRTDQTDPTIGQDR